jgi:hypothetical protein
MTKQEQKTTSKKRRSTVRHTRAIQRDRSKQPLTAPPDAYITARLTELLQPAITAQQPRYRALGLRARTLTLSVMVAIVISIIWRQLGSSGSEIARLLHSEGLLWVPVLSVSQQAISERLHTLPATLFWHILQHLLPRLRARWQIRTHYAHPILAWAYAHYTTVVAADGSTLDSVLRRVGLLREHTLWPLGGKLMALLDIHSWLPLQLWFEEEATAHDQRFWERLLAHIPAGALVLLDLGFTNFRYFARLTACTFITRSKSNLAFQVQQVLRCDAQVHDRLIWIGKGTERQLVRWVWVRYAGRWYRYLTNELDPAHLPPEYVAALYRQRWRIEDAFNVVKRLLGLAYIWTGSIYGILLQVWATWMVYGILVDLTDAVATLLARPFTDISIEMVYRGLYYFGQAVNRDAATDPVAYLAANADWLGLVKQRCKRAKVKILILTNSLNP